MVTLDEEAWATRARPAVEAALAAATGRGRGISVGTKVLHLKRPRIFPLLDRLVLDRLGATEAVTHLRVVEHLRAEGRRNLDELTPIQVALGPTRQRSLVRILDILLWATHPAAGLLRALDGWRNVVRRDGKACGPEPLRGRYSPEVLTTPLTQASRAI